MLEKVRKQSRMFGLDRLLASTTLVYGPPKVGKTTFAASWPDVLIVELEPGGADYVEADVIEISSLQELRALYAELRALDEKAWKWKTICLDTIDVISKYFETEIAVEYGKAILAGPSTAFGAEYARHRAEVMAVLRAFQALPAGLLMIAHSRYDERKTTLNLPGRYLAMDVMAMASNVIYLGITEDGRRECIVSPSPALEAGSRDPILCSLGRFPPNFQDLARLYEQEMARLGLDASKPEAKANKKERSVKVALELGEEAKEVEDVQS